MPVASAVLRKTFGSYDQYEFMIPQELASGCFQAFRDFFKKRPLQSVSQLYSFRPVIMYFSDVVVT
jgi:hypothetical protein